MEIDPAMPEIIKLAAAAGAFGKAARLNAHRRNTWHGLAHVRRQKVRALLAVVCMRVGATKL